MRVVVVCALAFVGCAAPTLSQDGQLVFSQGGARGASVITANGVEFMDRNEVPQPVLRRSANDPWTPATGFLLPADGVWRETSTAVPIQGQGLLVVLRSSDRLVPSWGGEILLRMDAMVPPAAFPGLASSLRASERLAIVIDGHGPNTAPLVDVALDNLGERDRVCVVDTARARTVMPLVPGTHRTLLHAAVERVVGSRKAAPSRDLAGALAIARNWIGARGSGVQSSRHVLVVSDGVGIAEGGARVAREVAALRGVNAKIVGVGSDDRLEPAALASLGEDVHAGKSFQERERAIERAVPPPGDVALKDVSLRISSVPAPARIIELSGGTAALALDEDHAQLGDLYAGEARTEVARIALPVWVPGEPLEITVTAKYTDAATDQPLSATATLACRYSSDVAAIAEARHGDVIAYASALAMVRRLDRAFSGSSIDRLGGLRPVVAWQARSLDALARTNHDPALATQAEILQTLLSAIQD